MSTRLHFDFIWVPNYLGGHSAGPYEGMRTTIRWQKYLSEFLQCAWDVQWETFSFDPESLQGSAICEFKTEEPLPEEWLKDGEFIELLSGFHVLAIGRITQ